MCHHIINQMLLVYLMILFNIHQVLVLLVWSMEITLTMHLRPVMTDEHSMVLRVVLLISQ
jgi:hypothetical protein